jgi:hypothetical protein
MQNLLADGNDTPVDKPTFFAGKLKSTTTSPGIEDLVSLLTDESVLMPTSALAVITLPGA